MKNETIDLTESIVTLATSFRDDTNKEDININNMNNKALCRYLRQSVQTCINQKCNKNAFLCADTQCHCRKEHPKCMKINTQDLITNVQEKIVSVESLELCINQRVQEMIDSLSKFREDTINQMRKDFEYFGLNQIEKEFLRDVNNGKQQTMTGSKIWEIIHAEENCKQIIQSLNFTKNKINKHFNQLNSYYQRTQENIKTKLRGNILKVEYLLQKPIFFQKNVSIDSTLISYLTKTIDSKIINSIEEIQNLLYFFSPRMIKSFKLLYRASENQFLTKIFHQKCDHIPDTLVLVETQYNKKIGGYTPIQWRKQSDQYVKDQSDRSFVFSVSTGEKFHLVDRNFAVYHHQDVDEGPQFGYNKDLSICNKADQQQNSYGNINGSYINQIHDSSSKQTIQSFIGNSYSRTYFKVKEWQVWKLDFEQNDE